MKPEPPAVANAVLVAVFIFEAAIKMVAYGSSYFKDGGNVFDFVIALFSALEAFFLSGSGLGSLRALRLLRIFRTFRVMRIFKMFR